MPPPTELSVVDPWKEAALKVEQDRGEPMGRAAQVEIPDQVKHYSDTRRFLAIQIAESRKQQLRTPHDFGELAELIRSRELAEVPALGNGYILYGVGLSASEDRFAHYDIATGKSVPLFPSDAELQQEYDQINQTLEQENTTNARLRKEIQQAPRRDRELRKRLQTELSATEQSLGNERRKKQLLDAFYRTPSRRTMLESEYQNILAQSQQFSGQSYRLDDGPSRKTLKARLLSYVRPAALRVLESLAQAYQSRFNRPLAITSLIRTDEYQHYLRGSNPNATLVPTPPHTTGLAFDILYKFLTADEQMFLMSELARLRDEAKIEVLRENRDHFHVFVFLDGARPEEKLIKAAIGIVGPEPAPASRKPRSRSRATKSRTRRR